MKYLILLSFLTIACTKASQPVPSDSPTVKSVACDVQKAVTSAASQSVAKTLGCANAQAVNDDIDKAIGSSSLCEKMDVEKALLKAGKFKGILGDSLCPGVVNSIVKTALTKIPATWECKGSVTTANITELLTKACKENVNF